MKLPDGVTVRNLINGCFELYPAHLFEAERLTQQLCSRIGVSANRGSERLLCVGGTAIQKDACPSQQARKVLSYCGSDACHLEPPPQPLAGQRSQCREQ